MNDDSDIHCDDRILQSRLLRTWPDTLYCFHIVLVCLKKMCKKKIFLNKADSVVCVNAFEKNVQIVV